MARHYRSLPVTTRGSGEQYVRSHYARAVQAFRSQSHDANASLVVMTDADMLSVAARRKTLDDALRQAEQAPRSTNERIVLLIPKRNVETWVAHLNGAAVDENSDYKPRPVEEFRSAATQLHAHCGAAATQCCPPSLLDGCTELHRLS